MNQRIVWLDPAIETRNAGDNIISESIAALDLPSLADAERLTTHRTLRRSEVSLLRDADVIVLGGTNALHSRQVLNRQWPLTPWQIAAMRGKTVFLGVGWWQYQGPPTAVTRTLLKYVSHPTIPHALRDEYSASRLRAMGLDCLMTSCPTMWQLDGVNSRLSPNGQASVVTTLTDYHFCLDKDFKWLRRLKDHYKDILVVGMGPGDEPAFRRLPQIGGVHWAGYGSDGLRETRLETSDYVGTRLHAAVRWLQMGGNAQVIAVDNRAIEIGRDTGLPVVTRDDDHLLQELLQYPRQETLKLPTASIRKWRNQWTAQTSV